MSESESDVLVRELQQLVDVSGGVGTADRALVLSLFEGAAQYLEAVEAEILSDCAGDPCSALGPEPGDGDLHHAFHMSQGLSGAARVMCMIVDGGKLDAGEGLVRLDRTLGALLVCLAESISEISEIVDREPPQDTPGDQLN